MTFCETNFPESGINWGLIATFTSGTEGHSQQWVKVDLEWDEWEEGIPILKKLREFPSASVSFRIEKFGPCHRPGFKPRWSVNFIANEMEIPPSERLTITKLIRGDHKLDPRIRYEGKITVFVEIKKGSGITSFPLIPQLVVNKKILDENLESDMVITAGNGVKIKCHKSFLSANSSVLQTMLHSGLKETTTCDTPMDDMSEDGVKSFLAYLYYVDKEKPKHDSEVAFELYSAGHKYFIPRLMEDMKNLLQMKEPVEFNLELVLNMFCFVRNIEETEALQLKAASVVKSKVEDLEDATEFKTLFRKHPEAAKELFILCCRL